MIAIGACAHSHRLKVESGPLSNALSFHEKDGRGARHDFDASKEEESKESDTKESGKKDSGTKESTGPRGSLVPAPGLVDIDSLVQIEVDKKRLGADRVSRLDPERATSMQTELAFLRGLVAKLQRLGEAERQTLLAYQALADAQRTANVAEGRLFETIESAPGTPLAQAWTTFANARKASGDERNKVIAEVVTAFEGDYPDFYETLKKALFTGGLAAVGPLLEARIRERLVEMNGQQDKWLRPLEDTKPQLELQMEAWLVSGKERAQIHLPCYDDLDEGTVKSRNSSVLDLSEEDRAALDKQWQSTVAVAKALEGYRNGTAKLDEVVASSKALLAPEVLQLIDAAQKVHDVVKDRIPATFVADTKADIEALRKELRTALDGVPAALVDPLLEAIGNTDLQLGTARRLAVLVATLADLRTTAQTLTPANVLGVIFDMRTRLQEAATVVLAPLPAGLEQDAEAVQALAKQQLQVLRDNVSAVTQAKITRVEEVLKGPAAKKLEERFAAVRDVYRAAKPILKFVTDVVLPLLGTGKGIPRDLGMVRSRRVPVEKIKNTAIDLQRTPREEGDVVEFRARLYEARPGGGPADQEPLDELTASFEVQRFGWHDRLSPSVVLLTPTGLAGRDETFSFAPVLSWVHRYGVRPEQSGVLPSLQRFFDTSIGVHAAFVDFDPDKEVEIGLGVTLSFWHERLQIGAGANLMAQSADDPWYVFVGSDLISLLNTIGIGK